MTRVLVLYDAGFADVVTRHKPGHAIADAAAVLGDAEPLAAALVHQGYDAVARAAPGEPRKLAALVDAARADVVVNLCDTLGGRGDRALLVPALLDAMGVPFAGASAAGLALSRRKHDVKAVLSRDGLPTPRFQVIGTGDDAIDAFSLLLAPPVIVKLTAEHASVGLEQASVCVDEAEVKARARHLAERFSQPILVEEYVDGRELSVSFLGDPPRAFDPMEHPFDHLPPGYLKLRTFDTKWTDDPSLSGERGRVLDVPVRAPSVPVPWTIDGMVEACRRAFLAVGCRDWGRVDVRIDRGGVPMIIDVTPNTYLGKNAPCVQAAHAAGMSLGEFGRGVVEGAWRRASPSGTRRG